MNKSLWKYFFEWIFFDIFNKSILSEYYKSTSINNFKGIDVLNSNPELILQLYFLSFKQDVSPFFIICQEICVSIFCNSSPIKICYVNKSSSIINVRKIIDCNSFEKRVIISFQINGFNAALSFDKDLPRNAIMNLKSCESISIFSISNTGIINMNSIFRWKIQTLK